jgi:hypothetical protein
MDGESKPFTGAKRKIISMYIIYNAASISFAYFSPAMVFYES